ncbi:hypothetical protein, partial [Bradyrhizobium sp.]
MLFRTPDSRMGQQPGRAGSPDGREALGLGRRLTLTTRLAIAMILLVAMAVFAVGWLGYRSLESALLPRALDRIEAHSRLMATELENYVGGARNDLNGYRASPNLATLIRTLKTGGP